MNRYDLLDPILENGIFNSHFFNGRLLTAEDLQTEQKASRQHRRLLGQAVGAGIVTGLMVRPEPNSSAEIVLVSAGLAINREGQALHLSEEIQLLLVPEKEKTAGGEGLFTDCIAVTDSFTSAGVYLLVISPASAYSSEQAPMQGFFGVNGGTKAENCNYRYTIEGVQFRLLRVPVENQAISQEQATTLQGQLGASDLKALSKLRNRLAHLSLGTFAAEAFRGDPFARTTGGQSVHHPYGLLDGMRSLNRLLPCDVPLALVFWKTSGIEFIDLWSVRRRTALEPLSLTWPLPVTPRRLSEAEAQFLQFQEQLAWLQSQISGQGNGVKAKEYFDYLPPAGWLPGDLIGQGSIPANIFFNGFPRRPLDVLSAAASEGFLRMAVGFPAIDLSKNETIRLYRTPENQQARSQNAAVEPAILFTSSQVPLVNIRAKDVSFESQNCPTIIPTPKTVQEILEHLCQFQPGACQLTVTPGPGWEASVLAAAQADLEVCLMNGRYPLNTRLIINGKRHVKITGAGPGTQIVVQNDEVALQFQNCTSVLVRDLTVEAQKVGSSVTGEPTLNVLRGALTFQNCGSVTLEHVDAICGSGAEPAATCITVANIMIGQAGTPGQGTVRIRGCNLRVGLNQIGILLTDVPRARIVDNLVRVGKKTKKFNLTRLLGNKAYRAAVRNLMIREVKQNPANQATGNDQVFVQEGRFSVRFRTDATLKVGWERLMSAIPPRGVQSARDLQWHLYNVADKLLLNEGAYAGVQANRTEAFDRWFKTLEDSMRTAADQGIVVGGRIGKDIQIRQNTIWGVHRGIHVGFSHADAPGYDMDQGGSVTITDNEISLLLSPGARLRHGIFVGNHQRVQVENNTVEATRFAVTETLSLDGIRLYGHFGEKLIARANSLLGTTTGIRIKPLNNPARKLWLVAENVMPNADLVAPQSVSRQNNVDQ